MIDLEGVTGSTGVVQRKPARCNVFRRVDRRIHVFCTSQNRTLPFNINRDQSSAAVSRVNTASYALNYMWAGAGGCVLERKVSSDRRRFHVHGKAHQDPALRKENSSRKCAKTMYNVSSEVQVMTATTLLPIMLCEIGSGRHHVI